MNHSYSYMGQVLVVMEGGVTHAHGAQPGICEVLSLNDSLCCEVCEHHVQNYVIRTGGLNRYLWIKVNQVEGDGNQEHPEDDETF
mgnify:CR=1 FL=1